MEPARTTRRPSVAALALTLTGAAVVHLAALAATGALTAAPGARRELTQLRLIALAPAMPRASAVAPAGSRATPLPGNARLAVQAPPVPIPETLPAPDAFLPGLTERLASDDSDYVIASELSQRPMADGEVEVGYPEVDAGSKAATVVLTLYINERGALDRIELEDSDAPGPFAEAARRAFDRATFAPGRIGDHAVKTRMRIEVAFDPAGANV